ncbi:E3 SUMO-protein ligase ZBED1-like [Lytechinus variegatus]|uniref:E3 SUMO-protein ligase ZBED1-like n=1 Tax=Lytechinus variegatus TaxID=7654 RepID=UPI001BB267F9|nr:E3 SUMO-protein ligase ZBED1-like [Lytechinus variegatus]
MRPIYIVEEKGFRDMIKVFDPRYSLPSRKTFSTTVIPRMYDIVREQTVLPRLERATSVAITTDMWTSRASDQYIGVTVHFIDDDWKMGSFTLENRELPPPHDNEHIAEVLRAIIAQWALENKVSAVVTDNATNITKAVREGLSLPNIPCFGHTLNLVVKAGLKCRGIQTTLARCSKLVEFVHRSAKAKYCLASHQKNLNVPEHKLIQDVETRWGSTHDMLRRILEQQQPISNLLIETKRKELDLSDREVSIAEQLVELLQPLKEITESLSSESQVTISNIIPTICMLEHIFEVDGNDLPDIVAVKRQMSEKLAQYYVEQDIQDFLSISAFLDGRFKRLLFFQEEKRARVCDVVARELTENISAERRMHEPASDIDIDGESEGQPKTKKQKSLAYLISQTIGELDEEENLPRTSPESEARDEINRYLREPKVRMSGDPLSWWKLEEGKFPTLAAMARKYLCTPATSVPSERLFSVAGNIVTAKRSLLTPENVGMLTFLHDNTPK